MSESDRDLVGIGVSPGIAIGPVIAMGAPIGDLPPISGDIDQDLERDRATRALEDVATNLGLRQERADGAAAAVLAAQVLMAGDPALLASVHKHVAAGLPAPHAIDHAIDEFKVMFAGAGAYMAERVADLEDIRNRAVARLLHLPMPGIPNSDTPYVLVAEDLAPADTVDLDPAVVLGLVTSAGGPTAHTAIIAKAMGLPAIVACPGILELARGTNVIVDGGTGAVAVDPDDAAVERAREGQRRRMLLLTGSSGPGRTSDGHPVKLMVNFGGTSDIAALATDAEGVGLLRSEFLFMDRTEEPSKADQVADYQRVFAAFDQRKVVVRTLDIGADKPVPFVAPGPGDNPALGLRGHRLRTFNPGLVERQLEAIAAAQQATGANVHVMAPMIATVDEAVEFVAMVRAVGLQSAGVMVEVPSIALQARRLAQVVDFVSIGTNDLSQYTFAADRMVGELGPLLDPWQPAILELMHRTITEVRAVDKPVGVCGEAASDPLLAIVLTGMGVTSLSMAPGLLPEVRAAIGAHDLVTCQAAAAAALDAGDPMAARQAVTAVLEA